MPACLWLQLRRFAPDRGKKGDQSAKNGAKIIVCDPRRIETARIADQHLQLKNGSNMALVNAFGYVLLEEKLYDQRYVTNFTTGLDAYREIVKDYAPEAVEHLTGVPARQVREAMRTSPPRRPPPLCGGWALRNLVRRWMW
jgi:anaerobic selenocysteine-containing dehydrogenase